MTVNEIYETTRLLLSKDHAGYFSNDEFNRLLKLSESALFEYYLSLWEKSRVISAPILVFHKHENITASGGVFAFPDDYRYRTEVLPRVVEVDGTTVNITGHPAYYLPAGSKGLTLTSAIRKPSIANRQFFYEENEDGFTLYPTGNYQIQLYYFRNIVYAVRGVVINETTVQEDYNSGSSTQPEWGDNELDNLVDLVLFFKGIRLRENAIIDYIATKKNLAILPEKAKL